MIEKQTWKCKGFHTSTWTPCSNNGPCMPQTVIHQLCVHAFSVSVTLHTRAGFFIVCFFALLPFLCLVACG